MKILLSITTLAIVLFSSSCRTSTPIDPNTMEPSTRCLPAPTRCTPGYQETVVHPTK